MSKVYEPTEAEIVEAEKLDPRVQYYRPIKGARIRNPEDRGIVPVYGVRVTRNHSMWARYVRDKSCERINRDEYMTGRDEQFAAAKDDASAKNDAAKEQNEAADKARKAEERAAASKAKKDAASKKKASE